MRNLKIMLDKLFLHRFKKQVSLFIGRQKFYFQRQLHNANIQNFSYIINMFNFGNAKAGAFLPSALCDQWVSCAKLL